MAMERTAAAVTLPLSAPSSAKSFQTSCTLLALATEAVAPLAASRVKSPTAAAHSNAIKIVSRQLYVLGRSQIGDRFRSTVLI